ncbi:hypothetical protein JKF63_05318 [Porcisia hertigi]|uniref:Uncharacterized protein n=1 Tax=Porcisia hertigi TaxID=2761500 RepID=A0A836ICK0_9TRYP|nr:hypothetical protein JKF63_05318 [Porcisia hertigi]
MEHLEGHTTKQTYVTRYRTDVDPRTLPDFATRGTVPAAEGGRDGGVREERRENMKDIHLPSHSHEGHRHELRHSRDSPPFHDDGAPPRGHGYRPPPSFAPYANEHGYNEVSASASSGTASRSIAASSTDDRSLHRLRKKYTTTTVTTVTTTTILLPKMQEAYVLAPAITSHQTCNQGNEKDAQISDVSRGGVMYEDTRPLLQRPYGEGRDDSSGSGRGGLLEHTNVVVDDSIVPSKPQPGRHGEGSRPWEFHQHTTNQVGVEESREGLPTLQDLGIQSFFDKNGVANGSLMPERREAPYTTSAHHHLNNATPQQQQQQQPWVAAETRYEVEGGKRHY